jgi:hypothetical protein
MTPFQLIFIFVPKGKGKIVHLRYFSRFSLLDEIPYNLVQYKLFVLCEFRINSTLH